MEAVRESGRLEKLRVHKIIQVIKDLLLALAKIIATLGKSIVRMVLPYAEKSLCGQVVLITGAGCPIGRELAIQFADLGCTVACADIDETSNQETVSRVNLRVESLSSTFVVPAKKAAVGYTCNVHNQQDVMRMSERVEQDLGRIDILVNSHAREGADGPLNELSLSMISNFWTVMAVLPGMITRKHGHIVALSSKTDLSSSVDMPECSSAQFAVAGLMDSINKELHLEENNIHITCVHPCMIRIKPNLLNVFHLRTHELSPEFSASEIIRAIRLNMTTLTIPRNVIFWMNVFRTMPHHTDTRQILQNMFLAYGTRSHIESSH